MNARVKPKMWYHDQTGVTKGTVSFVKQANRKKGQRATGIGTEMSDEGLVATNGRTAISDLKERENNKRQRKPRKGKKKKIEIFHYEI